MPWLAPARNGSAWECSWTRTTAATGCWWWVLGTVALCKDDQRWICYDMFTRVGISTSSIRKFKLHISINKDLTVKIGLSSNKRWDFHLQNQQIFFPQRHWASPVTSPASQLRETANSEVIAWVMVLKGLGLLSNTEDGDQGAVKCWGWWWLVALEHEFYDFPFSWEWNHHPNWRTHSMIFQRGRSTQPPTRLWLTIINHIITI